MALQVRTLRHFSQALTWSSRTAWTWCHLRTIWRPSSAHVSFASCCAWTHWSLASFVRKFYSSTKAREIRACRVMISTKGCQGERTLCFRVWLPYLQFLSLFGTHMWALSAHWWPLSRRCSSSTSCRWPRSRKRFTFNRKNHLRRMTTFRWRNHREFNLSERWKRMIRSLIVTLQNWPGSKDLNCLTTKNNCWSLKTQRKSNWQTWAYSQWFAVLSSFLPSELVFSWSSSSVWPRTCDVRMTRKAVKAKIQTSFRHSVEWVCNNIVGWVLLGLIIQIKTKI